jgi:uncharacterized protein (DUF2141 family)
VIFGETKQMMTIKFALIFFGVAGTTASAFAQASLEVKITNITSKDGLVRVALYQNEENFLNKALKTQSARAEGDEVVFTFENLSPGEYAISSFHDKNSDEKLDKNWVGVPVEPYGFSKDARSMFGPPSFSEAKFKVIEGTNRTELSIK